MKDRHYICAQPITEDDSLMPRVFSSPCYRIIEISNLSAAIVHTVSMYSSSLDAFPLTNGVHTVIAAPSGYHIDFENPHRDTYTMTRIYGCFAIGLLLSFVFLFQNLYVKVFVVRKLDAPTGQC